MSFVMAGFDTDWQSAVERLWSMPKRRRRHRVGQMIVAGSDVDQVRRVRHRHQAGRLRAVRRVLQQAQRILRVASGRASATQPGGGAEELIAPSVLNSTPADAVVSFDTTVLLTKVTFSASCIDTPPPSQPATLLAMTLLVTVTSYHCGC